MFYFSFRKPLAQGRLESKTGVSPAAAAVHQSPVSTHRTRPGQQSQQAGHHSPSPAMRLFYNTSLAHDTGADNLLLTLELSLI